MVATSIYIATNSTVKFLFLYTFSAVIICRPFRKGRGTRDQIANIHWLIEKAREFQKNVYFCFIDYAKGSDCVDHNKLWEEKGIPDYLTYHLRNMYAGFCRQELELGVKLKTGSK